MCDEYGNCHDDHGKKHINRGPAYLNYGMEEKYIEVLVTLIAGESSSGTVPPDVSYQKAWALLNLYTHHLGEIWRDTPVTPFEAWKSAERGLLDIWGITGTVESQVEAILTEYASYKQSTVQIESADFSAIERVVKKAASEWYQSGPNSMLDPVNGSTGFFDASGVRNANGVKLGDTSNYTALITNPVALEVFRQNNYPNSTYVYPYGRGGNKYTFTCWQ